MPQPVSRTRTTAWLPRRSIVTEIRPPAAVNLAALLRILPKTWVRRTASPFKYTGSRDSPDVEQVVDQPAQMVDLSLQNAARLRDLAGIVRRPAHDLKTGADRRHRVAQLVRQDRQELGLATISSLGARACVPQRRREQCEKHAHQDEHPQTADVLGAPQRERTTGWNEEVERRERPENC